MSDEPPAKRQRASYTVSVSPEDKTHKEIKKLYKRKDSDMFIGPFLGDITFLYKDHVIVTEDTEFLPHLTLVCQTESEWKSTVYTTEIIVFPDGPPEDNCIPPTLLGDVDKLLTALENAISGRTVREQNDNITLSKSIAKEFEQHSGSFVKNYQSARDAISWLKKVKCDELEVSDNTKFQLGNAKTLFEKSFENTWASFYIISSTRDTGILENNAIALAYYVDMFMASLSPLADQLVKEEKQDLFSLFFNTSGSGIYFPTPINLPHNFGNAQLNAAGAVPGLQNSFIDRACL